MPSNRLRIFVEFLIGLAVFIAQIHGFTLAFIPSVLLLVWQLYQYDLPKIVFKSSHVKSDIPMKNRNNLRIVTATTCGVSVAGAILLQIGFSQGLDFKARTFLESPSLTSYILIILIGGLVFLIARGLSEWYLDRFAGRFNDSGDKNLIKRYSRAHFAFYTYATFLGFGGDFLVTLSVLGISILRLLHTLQKKKRDMCFC